MMTKNEGDPRQAGGGDFNYPPIVATPGTIVGFVSDIDEIREVAKSVAIADEKIKLIVQMKKQSWVVTGRALRCVEVNRGFTGLGFKSMEEYIVKRFEGVPRSSGFRALALITALERLDDALLLKIPLVNAMQLKKVAESIRFAPATLKKAQTMSGEAFADFIDSKLVGAEKGDAPGRYTVKGVTKSLKKVVDKALTIAKFYAETDADPDGLEYIVTFFLNAKCEMEGFTNLSNLEAFEKMKKKRR